MSIGVVICCGLLLSLGLFFCAVVSDGAAGCSADTAVMAGDMASHTTYCGTFQTTFGLSLSRKAHCKHDRQSE